jgi:hypothetical protein
MRNVTVTLGDRKYAVPLLNIGQIELLVDLFEGPRHRIVFGVLRVAMTRAEPRPADVDAIEATMDEVSAAVTAILECSGLQAA